MKLNEEGWYSFLEMWSVKDGVIEFYREVFVGVFWEVVLVFVRYGV